KVKFANLLGHVGDEAPTIPTRRHKNQLTFSDGRHGFPFDKDILAAAVGDGGGADGVAGAAAVAAADGGVGRGLVRAAAGVADGAVAVGAAAGAAAGD